MKKDKTIDYYRECFSTAQGKMVLANLLAEAKFFEYTKTHDDMAVENFVKTILIKTGTYHPDNLNGFVDKLFELPTRR
ncbi:MAG: hypothetical protein KAS32_10730 [Candidatus Peribacteraceae bacterium]|nr:hypothetical protein [Candidatus Peribacteraceae bacterium]